MRCRSSLNRRTLSIAMNCLGGEILHQLDLLVGERPHLLAKEVEGPDQLALLQHWNAKHGPNTSRFDAN